MKAQKPFPVTQLVSLFVIAIIFASCKSQFIPRQILQIYVAATDSALVDSLNKEIEELRVAINSKIIKADCPCLTSNPPRSCPCPGGKSEKLVFIDFIEFSGEAIQILSSSGNPLIEPLDSNSIKIGNKTFFLRTYRLDTSYEGPATLIIAGLPGLEEREIEIRAGKIFRPSQE